MRSFESCVSSDSDYYVYTPSVTAHRLFFYPVCAGRFTYLPGYTLKRNSYNSYLLMYLTEGECRVSFGGKTLFAAAGDLVLLDCYVPHGYRSDTGWVSCWLHFDGPQARKFYEHLSRTAGNVLRPADPAAFLEDMNRILDTFRNGETINEALFHQRITAMLTQLFLSDAAGRAPTETRLTLSDTIAYINEHFAEPISLEDLAAHASLSPYYFSRIFTAETGMSPHQYLIAARIDNAKFLLKASPLPIKEIAYATGFTSESSFCTSFRKREKITPGAYRSSDAAYAVEKKGDASSCTSIP